MGSSISPYAKKTEPQKELAFVLNNLEALEPNSVCIAIVPMSCAVSDSLKELILEKHTLEAVMSMPVNLFHDSKSGTVPCIMVFRTNIPHKQSDKKTWFGYWRNDGFVIKRREGRVDSNNTWKDIKKRWIEMYRNRETIDGLSLMRKVTEKDEWCIEAYLNTKYTDITDQLFIKTILEYLSFLALNADFTRLNGFVDSRNVNRKLTLDNVNWMPFNIGGNNGFFEVTRGINIPVENNDLSKGTMVISANTNNNGFSHFLDKKAIFSGNVITLGNTGQSSVGVAFYQPYPFIGTNNINILVPKFKFNEYIGMFIVSVIKKERYKYSFGRVLDKTRTEKLKINLPSDNNGNPDWQFMEDYIKSLSYSSNI